MKSMPPPRRSHFQQYEQPHEHRLCTSPSRDIFVSETFDAPSSNAVPEAVAFHNPPSFLSEQPKGMQGEVKPISPVEDSRTSSPSYDKSSSYYGAMQSNAFFLSPETSQIGESSEKGSLSTPYHPATQSVAFSVSPEPSQIGNRSEKGIPFASSLPHDAFSSTSEKWKNFFSPPESSSPEVNARSVNFLEPTYRSSDFVENAGDAQHHISLPDGNAFRSASAPVNPEIVYNPQRYKSREEIQTNNNFLHPSYQNRHMQYQPAGNSYPQPSNPPQLRPRGYSHGSGPITAAEASYQFRSPPRMMSPSYEEKFQRMFDEQAEHRKEREEHDRWGRRLHGGHEDERTVVYDDRDSGSGTGSSCCEEHHQRHHHHHSSEDRHSRHGRDNGRSRRHSSYHEKRPTLGDSALLVWDTMKDMWSGRRS